MVAIFTGLGSGFERGSGAALGGAGVLGGGSLGRGGENVSVNAANGNLLLTRQDEFLVGRGPDVGISRTYNSRGALDENGDDWRQSTDRRVFGHVAGESVKRVSADGSEITYTYIGNGTYRTTDGSGAHDTLEFSSGVWTWTDGSTQITEKYAASGTDNWRIIEQQDLDGNKVSFTYDASDRLIKIKTANGSSTKGFVEYTWTGNNITSIKTTYLNASSNIETITRVGYAYDTQNRLIKVTTDLNLTDNDIIDKDTTNGTLLSASAAAYRTIYTYDGTSNRIASIEQTDGSKMEFTYDGSGRVKTITQTVAAGDVRLTTLTYSSDNTYTYIDDHSGHRTTLFYDENNQLTQIRSNPAQTGAGNTSTFFEYDAAGNVRQVIDSEGGVTSYLYDQRGNVLRVINAAGVVTHRSYDEDNNLIRETTGESYAENQIKGGDLSLGDSIFTNFNGYNGANYTHGIQPVDGEDAFVISTDDYNDYASGSRLAGYHKVQSGDLSNGAYYTVKAGETVNVSFEAKRLEGLDSSYARIYVAYYDASGTRVKYQYIYARDADDWTRGSGALVVPETAIKALVTAYVYGRDAGTTEAEPDVTTYALRDFKFTRHQTPAANLLFDNGLPNNTDFLSQNTDWEGGATKSIQTIDGQKALVLTDTGFYVNSSGSAASGSSHYFFGGDGSDGKSWAVKGGDNIEFGYEAKAITAASSNAVMYLYFYDDAGNFIKSTSTYKSDLSGWTSSSRLYVTPDNASSFTVRIIHYGQLHDYNGAPSVSAVAIRNMEVKNLGQEPSYATAKKDLFLPDGFQAGDTSFLYQNTDWEGGSTQSIQTIDGGEALVFHDTGFQLNGAGTTSYGSNYWLLGGDSDDGQYWSIREGDNIEFGLETKNIAGDNGAVGLYIYFYDETGTYLGNKSVYDTHTTSEWGYKSKTVEAFDNAVSFRARLYHFGTLGDAGGVPAVSEIAVRKLEIKNLGQTQTYQPQSINPDGLELQHTRFVYDENNHLRYRIGAEGTVTEYRYKTNGLLEYSLEYTNHAKYVSSVVPTLTQMENWRLGLNDTDHSAKVVRNFYNPRGQISRSYAYSNGQPQGAISSTWYNKGFSQNEFVYDQHGQLRSQFAKGLDENTQAYAYDGMGRLISSSDLNGASTSITFSDALNKTIITSSNGYVTTSTYNKAGELITQSDTATVDSLLEKGTSSFVYDKTGRLRMSTDQLGHRSYFVYDKLGRKVADINQYGHLAEYSYNQKGQIVATTRYTYSIGYKEGFTSAESSAERARLLDLLRNAPDNDLEIPDLRPKEYSSDIHEWNVYDPSGRVIETIDGVGSVVTYGYDETGQLVKTIGYSNTLDASTLTDLRAGPPTSVILPDLSADDDSISRTFYDKEGRILGSLNGEGHLTQIIYDGAGQAVQTIVYADATDVAMRENGSYSDLLGSIQKKPAQDIITRNIYNGQGHLRFSIDGLGFVTEFIYKSGSNYTANGVVRKTLVRKAAIAIPNTYTFNQFKAHYSFQQVKDAVAAIENTVYDRATRSIYNDKNQLVYSINDKGEVTSLTYDTQGQITKTVRFAEVYAPTATPTFGTMDNWVVGKEAAGRMERNYYNTRGELIFTVDAERYVTQNAYNKESNLSSTARYADQITESDSATISLVDDANKGSSVATTYTYDAMDRLVRVTDAIGTEQLISYTATGLKSWDIAAFGNVDDESRTRSYYDAAGNKTKELQYTSSYSATPRLTISTHYQYDGFGNVDKVTKKDDNTGSDDDRITNFKYDKNGQIKTSTDAENNVTNFEYDAFGNVVKTSVQISNTEWAESYNYYDKQGRLTKSVDAEGYITQTSYNEFSEVETVKRFYNQYQGDPSVDIAPNVSANSAKDATTIFTYDKIGRLISQTDAENAVTTTTYTIFSEVDTVTLDGAITDFDYDKLGRLTTTTNAEDDIAYLVYDSSSNVVKSTDFSGFDTYNYYDAVNRLTTSVNAESYITETTYTNRHQVESVKLFYRDYTGSLNINTVPTVSAHSKDAVTSFTYDRQGLVLTTTNAEGHVEEFEYNGFGNLVSSTDKRGNVTAYTYDKIDQLITTLDSKNDVTVNDYSGIGSLLSVARDGATTSFTYDKLGQVKTSTDAETHSESYKYNAFGNRTKVTNKAGGVTDYLYNRLGQLTEEINHIETRLATGGQHSASITTKYSYDERGNLVKKMEAFGLSEQRNTVFEYDDLNRVTRTRVGGDTLNDIDDVADVEVTSATGVVVSAKLIEENIYDANSNVIETIDANNAHTVFFYDKLGRVTHQVSPTGTLSHHRYNGDGTVERTYVYGSTISLPVDPLGTPPTGGGGSRQTRFTYDKLGQLLTSSVQNVLTGSYENGSFGVTTIANDLLTIYKYDANGNAVKIIDPNSDKTHSYYDSLGRKTSQIDQENYKTTWEYDSNGNVTKETRFADTVVGTPTIATEPADPIESTDDRITEFGYDLNGQRILEVRRNVVSFNGTDGSLAVVGNVGQDYSATTVERQNGDSAIKYTYNALGQVLTKIEASGDVTTYEYDVGGRLKTEINAGYDIYGDVGTALVSPEIRYHYDGLGNLTRLVQETGDVDLYTRNYYDIVGRKSSMEDASGFEKTYRYDKAGRVVREEYVRKDHDYHAVSNPLGAHTEAVGTTYDLSGRVTETGIVIETGGTWSRGGSENDTVKMVYNVYGDIKERGVNAKLNEKFYYDNGGRLWKTNSGDGSYKYFVYDNNGNQTLAVVSNGDNISGLANINTLLSHGAWSVNAAGATNLSTQFDDGVTATFTRYDDRNMAIRVIEPQRQLAVGTTRQPLETIRDYNAFGDVTIETDARGNAIEYKYNTMGRLIETKSPEVDATDANGVTTPTNPTERMYYDVSGRLVANRDANGKLTTQTLLSGTGYGGTEALITGVSKHLSNDAVYSTATTEYDVLGNARILTDEIGRVTEQEFDNMGRVDLIWRPEVDDNNASTAYDGLKDWYRYDGLGQRTTHYNNQSGHGLAHAETTKYDQQGRVIEQIAFGGDTTTTSYAWDSSLQTKRSNNSVIGTYGGWVQTTTSENTRDQITKTDAFGRALHSSNMFLSIIDRVDTAFKYDDAGRMTKQDGNGTELTSYTYLNTGRLATMTKGVGTAQHIGTYGYDEAGNLTAESLTINGVAYKNATATYDTLSRLTNWTDGANYLNYKYDKVGNIRNAQSSQSDYWYLYDSQNRVTLSKGAFDTQLGEITHGADGFDLGYDEAGQRVFKQTYFAATYYPAGEGGIGGDTPPEDPPPGPPPINDPFPDPDPIYYTNVKREFYNFNAAGHLSTISVGTGRYNEFYDPEYTGTNPFLNTEVLPAIAGGPTSAFTYTKMGQIKTQFDYQGGSVVYDRVVAYNGKDQIVTDTSNTTRDGVIHYARTEFYYRGETVTYIGATPHVLSGTGTDAKYALGNATRAWTFNKTDGVNQNPSGTEYNYEWHAGAVQKEIIHYEDVHNRGVSDTDRTTLTLNNSGEITNAEIKDGQNRNVRFINDITGQVIRRNVAWIAGGGGSGARPSESWYRFGGKQMGYSGNNGTLNTDAGTSVGSRVLESDGGVFRHGADSVTNYKDFDQSYTAINSYNQGSSAGTYTVRSGDSLQGIAASIYGDSSLWYKIGQANGLSGASTLTPGTTLMLPAGVTRNTNNASTFTPYNPGEALGDIAPTAPEPPKEGNNCGVMGAILLVVIAVAVSLATFNPVTGGGFLSAFIGSAATTTAVTATGVAGVAATGLTAAIGSTAAGFIGGAIAGAVGSIASQAVGVVTGIQGKFSWKAVGMAAIGGGVGASSIGGKAATLLAENSSAFTQGVIGGVAGNLATQGIGMATGLQSRFDFIGVAAAGIAGGIGGHLGKEGGVSSRFGHNAADAAGFAGGTLHDKVAGAFSAALTGAATGIASAATRSAISGTNFGDGLIAAIPDIVGQAMKAFANACFVGETLVQTPKGVVRIDALKVGDWVFARDEDFNTPTVHRKQVEELFRYEDRATLDVTIMDEHRNETTIRTTPEHPFAIDGQEAGKSMRWVDAGELEVGNRTIDMNGKPGTVTDITPVEGLNTVHNFSVTDDHTYFVSEQAVWVHNRCYNETVAAKKADAAIKAAQADPVKDVKTAAEIAEMIQRDAELGHTTFWNGDSTGLAQVKGLVDSGGRLALLKMRDSELYAAVLAELGTMPADGGMFFGGNTRYPSGVETFADLVPHLENEFQSYVQRGVERAISGSDFIDGFFDGKGSYKHILGTAKKSGNFNSRMFAKGVRQLGQGLGGQTANPEVAMQALGMLIGDESVSINGVIGVFDSLNAPTGSEIAHTFFAAGGFIPVFGAAFDSADGLLYAYEGRPGMAALSFAAAVPGWGDAAKAGYLGKTLAKGALKAGARIDGAVFNATEALSKLAGRACFAAGTPILTKEGLKPIEQIQEGDLVWSRSEFDGGETAWRKVLVAEATGEKNIYEVEITDGSKIEILRTTEEHPFWSETRGANGEGDFIVASELKPGEQLRLHDGSSAYVISVTKTDTVETVYNFTVDGFHTYHVGELGVWVHNQCLAAKVRSYAHALKMRTGMNIPRAQSLALKNAIRGSDYSTKLTGAAWDVHKAAYTRSQRNQMIKGWEQANKRQWPRYAEDVVNEATGKVVRKAGARYDLHHIIEKQYGGPHTWWNSAPLHVVDHTFKSGIHYDPRSLSLFPD